MTSSTIVCRRAKERVFSLHCFGNLAFNVMSCFGHFVWLLAGIPNCLRRRSRVSFDTVFEQASYKSASVVDETVCSGDPCSSGSVSSGQVRTSFGSTRLRLSATRVWWMSLESASRNRPEPELGVAWRGSTLAPRSLLAQ